MSLQVIETIAAMRAACAAARRSAGEDSRLGLVPTMGAVHEGHLSLVREAKRHCEVLAVSIFVNPAQFAPGEDFECYPRTFEADRALLESESIDLLFAPSAAEMYPAGFADTSVDVAGIGSRLDGLSRPGHFRGVATVVAKLFGIVSPDIAYFGQKDAAQVAVLQAMVRDLNFPVQLAVCPTVREPDGLALSSRNRYLSRKDRTQALALFRSLEAARRLAEKGVHDADQLRNAMRHALQSAPGVHLEYADIVDRATLLSLADLSEGALVAVAASVGTTRLIDNLVLLPTNGNGAA